MIGVVGFIPRGTDGSGAEPAIAQNMSHTSIGSNNFYTSSEPQTATTLWILTDYASLIYKLDTAF